MVRAIFFDVDGTLLSHTKNAVPDSTRRALNELRKKGIKCVVATGRHMSELPVLPVRDIDFDGYITLNGQLCLDAQKNVILANPITRADKSSIIRLFNEKTVPVMLVEKDAMYCSYINQSVEIAQRAISTKIPDVGVYTGNEIYQVDIFLDEEKGNTVFSQLPGCKITRWNEYAVDIISRHGGKAAGISEYLRLNHITREESMAFGDGENDVEMLQFVQTGVAMGNADSFVKEHADFVTDSIDDDGIENALIRLGII